MERREAECFLKYSLLDTVASKTKGKADHGVMPHACSEMFCNCIEDVDSALGIAT